LQGFSVSILLVPTKNSAPHVTIELSSFACFVCFYFVFVFPKSSKYATRDVCSAPPSRRASAQSTNPSCSAKLRTDCSGSCSHECGRNGVQHYSSLSRKQ